MNATKPHASTLPAARPHVERAKVLAAAAAPPPPRLRVVIASAETSPRHTEAATALRSTHAPEVARRALVALLEARDFLGYQLTHANGGMTDEQLEEIASEYLTPKSARSDAEVIADARALRAILGARLDIDALSTMLGVPVEQALRAMRAVLSETACG